MTRPEEYGEPDVELVKVFEAGDVAVLPLVESMLQDADIEFMTKGAVLQELFGIGYIGMGSNNTVAPPEIWVRKEDEAEARAVIAMLDEPAEDLPGAENE